MKTGRNEPCGCGSGKKTKHCCGRNDPGLARSNRAGFIIAAIVVVAAAAVIASMREESKRDPFSPFETSKSAPVDSAAPPATASNPAAVTPVATPGPQPAGPVPPGKVWSAEHGHWHDKVEANPWVKIDMSNTPGKTAGTTATTGKPAATSFPKPDMPTPPGKLWSAEHGHWHDAATGVAPATEIPAELESQMKPPAAPAAPEGMVWSPEHKHWHKKDAGSATDAAATTPATAATTTEPHE